MFKEANGDISVLFKGRHRYAARDMLALKIGNNKDTIRSSNPHTLYRIVRTHLQALFKCHAGNIQRLPARQSTTQLTRHNETPVTLAKGSHNNVNNRIFHPSVQTRERMNNSCYDSIEEW